MNNCQDVVFQLLKVALGNSDHVDYVSELVDWKMVMNLVLNQGIVGICFDAFCHIPRSARPDDKLFIKWMGQTLLMEERYRKYEETIIKLSEIAHNLGMKMLVLKGYGCSRNYPQPKYRPCGDIDIFLISENGIHSAGMMQHFETYLENTKGIKVNAPNTHHTQFEFQHFLVENHATILDVDAHKSSIYLNNLLEDLALSAEPLTIRDTQVWLPSVMFNSIHLLRHMANDFASVNTTIRNVLDWATFIETHEIDWPFVHKVADKANMNRFLDAINGICVNTLGYSAHKFPIEIKDGIMEHKVLKEILTCSDRQEHPQSGDSFMERLSYDFRKAHRMWRNSWKYQIVYNESLLESFLWKVKSRMKAH